MAIIFALASWQSILLCLLFSFIYVGSLYIWTDSKNRDHPSTIKKRFASVGVISLIVPPVLWCFSKSDESINAHSIFEWLGIRLVGIIPATVLPLLLTMILFLGPLALHYTAGVFRLYLEPKYWSNSFSNLMWIRNRLVAPFSEEFIFRACMLPLLVPTLGSGLSVFICPIFFGVAHFHHMIEKVVSGQQEVKEAFLTSTFQLCYTTVFGAYSAFLFLRTGLGESTLIRKLGRQILPNFHQMESWHIRHVMAPIIAHAFCNHMGFPVFAEVMGYEQPTRSKLIAAFVIGLITWILLLFPLTNPDIYGNYIYDLTW